MTKAEQKTLDRKLRELAAALVDVVDVDVPYPERSEWDRRDAAVGRLYWFAGAVGYYAENKDAPVQYRPEQLLDRLIESARKSIERYPKITKAKSAVT